MNSNEKVTAHNWFEHFARAYMAELGYVFLLSGNIADLFPFENEFVTLRQFWARQLIGREIAVFWDKSNGFSFADEILGKSQDRSSNRPVTMRDKFKVSVGLNEQINNQSSTTNLLGVLAGNGGNGELPTDPEEAFQLLEILLSQGCPDDRKAAVVVEYIESVIPEGDYSSVPVVTLQRWASLDSPLKGTGNPVILIERNPQRVSSAVKHDDSSVLSIHIPRPSKEELENFIHHVLKENKVQLVDNMKVEIVANLSAGLRCKDFDDFCMYSQVFEQKIDDTFIWNKKVELIEKQSDGVLQVIRPKHGFEAIGGLGYIKDALRVQIDKLRRGSQTTDKGWILMGPPGTGKSVIAEALAKESGVNFVILGNIMSKLVGDSERNMNLAMDIAIAMAPTIVFIDEAAEVIGNGDGYNGDSGVSERIRGKLQNVMGDEDMRGRLFFILATNYPERLSPAMLREGRMDKRVAMLAPDYMGRESIFHALCQKYDVCSEQIDFSSAIKATDGWTGAEIEGLLRRAKEFSHERNDSALVKTDDLDTAIDDYIVSRDQQAFDLMTAQAIRYSNSRRLLPESYRQQIDLVDNISKLESNIANRKVRRSGNLKL